jgi:hypothetical protein
MITGKYYFWDPTSHPADHQVSPFTCHWLWSTAVQKTPRSSMPKPGLFFIQKYCRCTLYQTWNVNLFLCIWYVPHLWFLLRLMSNIFHEQFPTSLYCGMTYSSLCHSFMLLLLQFLWVILDCRSGSFTVLGWYEWKSRYNGMWNSGWRNIGKVNTVYCIAVYTQSRYLCGINSCLGNATLFINTTLVLFKVFDVGS